MRTAWLLTSLFATVMAVACYAMDEYLLGVIAGGIGLLAVGEAEKVK